MAHEYVAWLEDLGSGDVARVGGKNASLGEMIRALKHEGVRVPDGFATTAAAYREYIEANAIGRELRARFDELNGGGKSLHQVGTAIRRLFLNGEFPPPIRDAILEAYRELSRRGRHGRGPTRGELRRPTGDLPQRARQAGPARRVSALLRLAVHRPRHRLPREQRVRPPAGRALGRRAEDGARGSGRRRRHVLDRHRDRFSGRGGDQRRMGAGREVRDEAEQERAARQLTDEGRAEVVVLSRGAAGALLVVGKVVERFAVLDVPTRSAVAPATAWWRPSCSAWHAASGSGNAVRFGMAAGAAALMTPGTELCRREDTERLYARMVSCTDRTATARSAPGRGDHQE